MKAIRRGGRMEKKNLLIRCIIYRIDCLIEREVSIVTKQLKKKKQTKELCPFWKKKKIPTIHTHDWLMNGLVWLACWLLKVWSHLVYSIVNLVYRYLFIWLYQDRIYHHNRNNNQYQHQHHQRQQRPSLPFAGHHYL